MKVEQCVLSVPADKCLIVGSGSYGTVYRVLVTDTIAVYDCENVSTPLPEQSRSRTLRSVLCRRRRPMPREEVTRVPMAHVLQSCPSASGSASTVEVAVKEQTYHDGDEQSIDAAALREVCILTALQHGPHVPRILHVACGTPSHPASMLRWESRKRSRSKSASQETCDRHTMSQINNIHRHRRRSMCITMPYYASCQRDSPMDVQELKFVACAVLRALFFIHSSGFIHRDIKPSNLLWKKRPITSADDVVLADFGHARWFEPCPLPLAARSQSLNVTCNDRTAAGALNTRGVCTLGYRAPELLLNSDTYTTAVDMWSLGVTLYELATGTHPFAYTFDSGESETGMTMSIMYKCGSPTKHTWPEGLVQIRRQFETVKEASRDFPKFKPKPVHTWHEERHTDSAMRELFAFLECLLVTNPHKRLLAFEALSHPFVHDTHLCSLPAQFHKRPMCATPTMSYVRVRHVARSPANDRLKQMYESACNVMLEVSQKTCSRVHTFFLARQMFIAYMRMAHPAWECDATALYTSCIACVCLACKLLEVDLVDVEHVMQCTMFAIQRWDLHAAARVQMTTSLFVRTETDVVCRLEANLHIPTAYECLMRMFQNSKFTKAEKPVLLDMMTKWYCVYEFSFETCDELIVMYVASAYYTWANMKNEKWSLAKHMSRLAKVQHALQLQSPCEDSELIQRMVLEETNRVLNMLNMCP